MGREKSGLFQAAISRYLDASERAKHPAPKGKLAKVLRGVETFADVSAQLGQFSSDPERRRHSQAYLADKGRRELLRHQRQQTVAGWQTVAALRSTANAWSDRSVDSLDESDVIRMLDRLEDYAKGPFNPWFERQVIRYGTVVNVKHHAALFVNGLVVLGYASRIAEEQTLRNGMHVTAVARRWLSEVSKIPGLVAEDIALGFACALSERDVLGETRVGIETLPGDPGVRSALRKASFRMMIAPGATFTAPPAELTTDMQERAWIVGYCLRCAEPALI